MKYFLGVLSCIAVAFVYFLHKSGFSERGLLKLLATQSHWVDVEMGFAMGALAISGIVALFEKWPSFEDGGGKNPNGSGGQRRTINLPFIKKVISIEEFKKMPPKGPVQIKPTGS